MTEHIEVRQYQPKDRKTLRRISYETSFLGKADDLFDEPEILADALTLYFTDSEPQSCFVAVKEGKVVGYLIGAKNEKEMDKVSWVRIYPRLVWTALVRGLLFKKKTFRFVAGVFESFMKGEFKAPDFSEEYPAIVHINISRNFRGGGIGQKLIRAYEHYLSKNGVVGYRASTMTDNAKHFFEKCGMSVLFTTSRSYLRYYCSKDIPIYILGKRLIS